MSADIFPSTPPDFSADFPNAQIPQLTPLRNMQGTSSPASAEYEKELRQLFLDLFDTYLASNAFDVNVLGMAHLGTLNLVQQSINFDGLVIPNNSYTEPAARYIYRAWKSRAKNGRGLFFLRTYLQCLFPGVGIKVEQQMAPINQSTAKYPNSLFNRSTNNNDSDKFLTSRLIISLDASQILNISGLIPIISAAIPARFVPKFQLLLYPAGGISAGYGYAAIGNPSITLRGSGSVY